jgi:hypothetical protein
MDGTKYELDSLTPVLELRTGDTDNDGDVDINDVTLFLAQFGGPEPAGSCPWNPLQRGADFSNNGNVGTEDYTLLSPEWLTFTSCGCLMPLHDPDGKSGPAMSISTSRLDRRVAEKADLNRDGIVDFRDVRIFEQANGLPDSLSTSMLVTEIRNRRK